MVIWVNLILTPLKRTLEHFFWYWIWYWRGFETFDRTRTARTQLHSLCFSSCHCSALQARLRPSKKWIKHGIAKDFLFIKSGISSARCRRKEKVEKKRLGRNREQEKFWSMLGHSLDWKVMRCAFSCSQSKLTLFPPDEWETRPACWLTLAAVYTVLSQEAWHR